MRMDRDGVIATMLLILVVAGVSDGSFGVNFRALMAEAKGDAKFNSQKISPSPIPDPSPKVNPLDSSQKPLPPKSNLSPLDADKSNTSLKISPELGSSASVQSPTSEPERKAPQSPNGDDPKGSSSSAASGSPTDTSQKAMCGASSEKCEAADLVACLQQELKELFLLVHNGGDDALNVNITMTTSINTDLKMLPLAKDSSEKISVSTNSTDDIKLVLNAGKGDCILHVRPSVPGWQQFPPFTSHLTPVYGAYLLFLTMVIVGGTWACCKFRRKAGRGDGGVPYQQLEMAQSGAAAVAANTADGWDQGWDDDWDEEEAAMRPSEKHPAGTISANGLTSRSPGKDRREWDD